MQVISGTIIINLWCHLFYPLLVKDNQPHTPVSTQLARPAQPAFWRENSSLHLELSLALLMLFGLDTPPKWCRLMSKFLRRRDLQAELGVFPSARSCCPGRAALLRSLPRGSEPSAAACTEGSPGAACVLALYTGVWIDLSRPIEIRLTHVTLGQLSPAGLYCHAEISKLFCCSD